MNSPKEGDTESGLLGARIVIVIMNINAQGICRSVVGAVLLECLPSQPAAVLAIDEPMEAFGSLMSLYIVVIGGHR